MNSFEETSTGIIVLGMHRSGTSLLTRLLALSGAWLGEEDEISAKGPDNPTGFWEHSSVKLINQCLLEAVGSDWDSIIGFDLRKVPPNIDACLRSEAEKVMSRLRQHRVWAVKDPRLCLTLPWWQQLFGNFIIIHCIRSPLDIARSLEQRNGFQVQTGIALWEFYALSALRVSRGLPAITVNYDDLVDDPIGELARLTAGIARISKVGLEPAAADLLSEFVSQNLRHSSSDWAATQAALSEGQVFLYEALNQGGKEQIDHLEISDASLQRLADHRFYKAAQDSHSPRGIMPGRDDTYQALTMIAKLRDYQLGQINQLKTIDFSLKSLRRELKGEIDSLRRELKTGNQQSSQLRRVNEILASENQAMNKWLADTLNQVELTRNSARWKVGDRLVRAIEMGLFRRRPRLALDIVEEIRQQYESLRKSGGGAIRSHAGIEADPRPALASLDFIIFPIIDWHFRIQRPQQLARELATAGHRVFYLSLQPSLGADEPGYEIIEKPRERVHLVNLSIPALDFPNVYKDALSPELTQQLLSALAELIDGSKLANPIALVDLPFWSPVAVSLPGAPVIYDCMDHHGGFSTATRISNQLEEKLVETCDLMVVTSRWLSDKYSHVERKCLIPNAGEIAFFSKVPERLVDFGNKPVVGYVGAIADWFDVNLVVEAARHRPDVDFVLVGSTDFCDTKKLLQFKNIKLVGEVPYADVPRYVHAFDCCFIPFRLTELIQATNPVKVYEYLAAGKPVVATRLPELDPISDLVHLAEGPKEFLSLIDTALAEVGDASLSGRRSAWASGHDWSSRRDALLAEIEALYPPVSVVVLCYNNLEFTTNCIKSLQGPGSYPNLELILVDNGSTDGTSAFIQDLVATSENVVAILNKENLGFAAGNNLGIAAATGEYVILLNNDTYTTPGWIQGLLRHLRGHPTLGLVSPVTNNIGNEAKIDIVYSDMKSMFLESFKYTSGHKGTLLYVPTVAFFCVAFSRQLLDQVGLLDEQFGQGFFEDDDYCRRVTDAGYEIAIAEDVFVHHHLSATFSQESTERRKQLFEENKNKYEAKWGKWKPHTYRR